jgi:hypothetical protein
LSQWKRRETSQKPGVWAGSLMTAKNGNLYVCTSKEKWDKCKEFLRRWKAEIMQQGPMVLLNHKDLDVAKEI